MEKQAKNPRRSTLLIGGIAAILVSGIAIGSMGISAQSLKGVVAPAEPPESASAPAVAASGARAFRCTECGVIVSMREVGSPDQETEVKALQRKTAGGETDGKPVRNYEVTVRMHDGSMRVLADSYPARWRLGERVIIIAGVN